MPLEQLANVAEVLGMFVVAITLVFLTVQMRQSTRATRSASATQSTSTVTAWYREMGSNEQSSALFYNALADPEARTPEEWIQFVYIFHGLLLAFQNSYYLAKEGTLDEKINYSLSEVMVAVKDQPGFHKYWRQTGISNPIELATTKDVLRKRTNQTRALEASPLSDNLAAVSAWPVAPFNRRSRSDSAR